MTYKKKLIEFITIKNSIIYTISNINYTNKKDIKDIQSWSEYTCCKIYKYIINSVNTFSPFIFLPSDTCPWCIFNILNNDLYNCLGCGYGKRHGFCNKSNSTYKKLLNSDTFPFLNKNRYKEIINNIKE